jgi:hypothetical protein
MSPKAEEHGMILKICQKYDRKEEKKEPSHHSGLVFLPSLQKKLFIVKRKKKKM